jgi:hypothetical protein
MALCALLTLGAAPKPQPSVYAVYFTADFCVACKIVTPAFATALKTLNDPRMERVDVDISNEITWDASTERVIEKGVVKVHNAYLGATGFVVLTAADTGERISCLTARISHEVMTVKMQRALETVRAKPPGQRFTRDLMCPPERQS